MINSLIRYIKKDNNYKLDKNITSLNLVLILIRRLIEVSRGMLYKPFIRYNGIIFIGKRVQMRHANKLLFGSGCIINDNVFIDALSVNGVQFGSNCTLGYGCRIIATDILRTLGYGIKIGNNSAIGSNSFIQGAGGITIGDDVIMGPNGSGKSTLANTIAGHPKYTIESGKIIYKNKLINDLSPEERSASGIFLALQYPVSIPGVKNIYFLKSAINSMRKSKGQDEIDTVDFLKMVRGILPLVGLDDSFLHRSVNDGFSGGEKKRNEKI